MQGQKEENNASLCYKLCRTGEIIVVEKRFVILFSLIFIEAVGSRPFYTKKMIDHPG
jgi:hypothetical protein